jgi:hypothetical protein
MDRRLFLKGLCGAAGAAAIGSLLPREVKALAPPALGDAASPSDVLPQLPDAETPAVELDEGIQLAYHEGKRHRRRRRRRVRRWRRRCRRYWHNGVWRRRCRRVPYWIYIWFSV